MRYFSEHCDPKIEANLKKVAKRIKHCGDYGKLYWHSKDKAVHWTMADGDGYDPHDENPLTSSKDIKKWFLEVPGVKKVVIGDEWSPKEKDGWERLEFKK